jgi:hypothetical protein
MHGGLWNRDEPEQATQPVPSDPVSAFRLTTIRLVHTISLVRMGIFDAIEVSNPGHSGSKAYHEQQTASPSTPADS